MSLQDLLLDNTDSTHFQTLNDQNFILITHDNQYYYHKNQESIYFAVSGLGSFDIVSKEFLDYNPNHLGGLKSGHYEVNYKDAKGYTDDFFDHMFTSYFDQIKRNIKLTLSPQKGKVHWYPEAQLQGNKVVLFYYHSIRGNHNFRPLDHEYAIKIEFENVEGFLGFLVVTYFLKGISPLQVVGEIDTRKDKFFERYVIIINLLLKKFKTDIDQALTYLHYIPADFFIKEQNLFLKMKDPDNILGAQFIWDIIGIALEDQLTNFGTNKEDIVLRLLKILKYIQQDENATIVEKNDFLLNQLLTKKTTDGISYLQALYSKMNTNNFVDYNTYIYKLWKQSSFINPENPIYSETSPLPNNDETENNKNKPRLIFPYKTNKLLGFYSSNINTEDFNKKGNIVITPDEKWVDNLVKGLANVGLGEIIEKFTEEDWKAEYHPLQPIYLADPTNDKAMELQRLSPMLLLKANEDKSFWSNVITTAEYGLDALSIMTGIPNIAKFRHLARAVQVAKSIKKGKKVIWYYKASKVIKGTAAAVEITSGTVNALLKITGIKDSKFGAALSEYLFWLELLSLSGELTMAIRKGLKKSSKEILQHEDKLDDLFLTREELLEFQEYRRLIKTLQEISETYIEKQSKLLFRVQGGNTKPNFSKFRFFLNEAN
ncbi:hypothetical protein [Lacinutrix salivirga]